MNDYKLYDFQSAGVAWIKSPRDNGFGFKCPANIGLFLDEMGLGKTAEALTTVKDLILSGKRILFIVPGATIIQWQKNYDRWILDLEIDEFHTAGLQAIRSSKSRISNDSSAIMSHAMVAKKPVIEMLANENFDGIVIDEIHKFGGTGTKRIKHLNALIMLTKSKFDTCRIGLSGTPVRNYAKEIYNIAHFLAPQTFRTQVDFHRKYLSWDGKALSNPVQFHSDFAPFYIRRTVNEVQKSLPSIRRTKLYTEITDPFIAKLYNAQLDMMSNTMLHGHKVGSFQILPYLIKCRHLTGIAKAKEPSIIEPMKDYLNGSNGIDGQHKIVIGFHHKLVEKVLRKSFAEFTIYRIAGGMTMYEKEHVKTAFINHVGAAILLLNIKTAGEGIDGLQFAACKAYVFERQWNGADELQFEKRIHRDGQKFPVQIEYTVAAATVDEFFDGMVDEKRRYTTQVEDEHWESNPGFLKKLADIMIGSRLPTNQVHGYEDDSILESIYSKPELDHQVPTVPGTEEITEDEINQMLQEVEYDILRKKGNQYEM